MEKSNFDMLLELIESNKDSRKDSMLCYLKILGLAKMSNSLNNKRIRNSLNIVSAFPFHPEIAKVELNKTIDNCMPVIVNNILKGNNAFSIPPQDYFKGDINIGYITRTRIPIMLDIKNLPTTGIFIAGKKGSGKSNLIKLILTEIRKLEYSQNK